MTPLMPFIQPTPDATQPVPHYHLGPATLTITDTALVIAIGPSRLIMTAEGIALEAPRIDLNAGQA